MLVQYLTAVFMAVILSSALTCWLTLRRMDRMQDWMLDRMQTHSHQLTSLTLALPAVSSRRRSAR